MDVSTGAQKKESNMHARKMYRTSREAGGHGHGREGGLALKHALELRAFLVPDVLRQLQ